MTVVKKEQQGPIRTRIEAFGPALALYKQSVRNKMVRNALIAAGKVWLAIYLLRRFKSNYAPVFGYPKITKRYAQRKAKRLGTIQPYMGFRPPADPTTLVGAALTGARSTATATGSKGVIRITVPYGHPLRAEYSAAFRNIPGGEIMALAEAAGNALAAELAGTPLTDANRKKEPKPRVVGSKGGQRRTGGNPRKVA